MQFFHFKYIGDESKGYIDWQGERISCRIKNYHDRWYLNIKNHANDYLFGKLGYYDAYDFYDKFHLSYQDNKGVWPFANSLKTLMKTIERIDQIMSSKQINIF